MTYTQTPFGTHLPTRAYLGATLPLAGLPSRGSGGYGLVMVAASR